MQLVLEHITKSYQGRLLFQNLNFSFALGEKVAVIGKNGSGKTTLLKIAMGYVKPDTGVVFWQTEGAQKIPVQFRDFSFAGIQQQLFDDLTVLDSIHFHFKFRTALHDTYLESIQSVFPKQLLSKKVNQLSAGWLNRLKLLLAILTKSKVLILDEPFSNMDTEGIDQLTEIIRQHSKNRLLLIAGNREDELALCERKIEFD